jgi:hypothetical protein
MKLHYNINVSILFLSVVTLAYLSFYSCKKITNPHGSGDQKDTINYNLIKTRIYIQFMDANTNEIIIPEEGKYLKVKIVGESQDAVFDIIGLQKEEYIAQKGMITFALDQEAEFIPSSSSPVRFSIVANMDNYLTSTKELTITDEGDYMLKIFMVDVNNPPDGVSIDKLTNVGKLINGVLQDPVSIVSQNGEAKIVIPAGSRLLDSDSTQLKGKLNLTLCYFNNKEDKALAAYTGGITGTVINNNSSNSGVFFSAGLLELKITDSDGHTASIIENKEVEVSTLISNQTYNPVSGSNIKKGDEVSLYTYLSDTGLWMFDQLATISDTMISQYYTTVKTTSFGNYNFSWFEKNNCNQGSKFKVEDNCKQCESIMLEGIVRKQDDDSYVSDIFLIGNLNEQLKIPFSTGSTPVYVEWAQGNECNYCYVDPTFSPNLIDNMCSQQLIGLPLTDDSQVTMSITAQFLGNCPSDTNIVVMPSFGVWIRPVDASCWRWSSMDNGIANICNVEYGETYVLGTYYNGSWNQWSVTISDDETYIFTIDFSQSVCLNAFGIL